MHYPRALFTLLLLLALGVLTTMLPLGFARLPFVLLLAALQGAVIVLGLMRVRKSDPLAALVFSIGLFWLGILAALTLSDFFTRP